ncbi:protein-glutamate methylesterase/protein-glutamine glutaminase [Pseudoalteromonas sp. SSM20]|uniref:protein-glutamate methylesterase/protein-glutamine glutaminase n=1 Tax=Pseudoalteromonas sp. SSM20 TaxID=3139394 RepID=UPI003BA841AB
MIRVLVVDDSPLIRAVLTEVLQQAQDIEVIGTANDPYQARDLIKQLNPDVLTLDVEMPKMDGVSFLKNLMRLRPMPVVMISTLTQQGAPVTLECLELGAVDFVAKPTQQVGDKLLDYAETLHEKIRAAAKARVRSLKPVATPVSKPAFGSFDATKLVAIGASTGGTEAIKELLTGLPDTFPPVVITQHIPPVFSASFAERMDRSVALTVKEAEDGELIKPNHVYIAPGDYHLAVVGRAGNLKCKVTQSPPVNRHRPAVDVLFKSIAKLELGNKVCASILTGMGADGAAGLLKLKEYNAYTLAQDEASSVVWGMPRAAIDLDAAHKVLSLDAFAAEITNWAKK